MSTAEALRSLREKLGMKQQDLARAIAIGSRSVYRYENGHEPNAEVLQRLADLAQSNGFTNLWEFFAVVRRASIRASADKLTSKGAARRVALGDIERWTPGEQGLQSLQWALEVTRAEHQQDQNWKSLKELFVMLHKSRHDMMLYRNGPDQGQPHFFHELMSSARDRIAGNLDQQTASGRADSAKINQRNREFWEKQSSQNLAALTAEASPLELAAAPIQKRNPARRKKR